MLALCLFNYIDISAQCGPGACRVCQVTATITSVDGGDIVTGTADVNGNVNAGESGTAENPLVISATTCGTISLTVELDFIWDQGNQDNWIHGISFFNSPGWIAAEGTIIPPDPGWIFLNEITGVCSGVTYGAGFYWDPPGSNCGPSGNVSSYNGTDCGNDNFCEEDETFLVDGDPSDNWGINCDTDCPQFGFDLTFCPSGTGTVDENITFFLTEDGETGGWFNTDGCIFELTFPITIESAGVQLPEFDEVICLGECFTLDAGEGCEDYVWSTGETSQMIEVCPTETTTYSVVVSGAEGCVIEGESTIQIEFCCEADAGELSADTPLCPGEDSNFSVINFFDDPDYTQAVFVIDENGIIIEIFPDESGTFTSAICGSFTIYSYNYLTAGAAPVPVIGLDISTIDCDVECCDLIPFEIEFEDTEAPSFPNAPGDITLICADDLTPMEDQDWEDNCAGTGTVMGVEDGTSEFCTGGTITRTWEITDDCDNTMTHVQTITIEPPLEAVFENPPEDETIACNAIPTMFDELAYSNGMMGSCLIEGMATPMVTEMYDPVCGGSILVEYSFTDICDRTINHSYTITIEPAPEATFTNPPADETVSCDAIPDMFVDLAYTNSEMGSCLIEGTATPEITEMFDPICGGTIVALYMFTDACDRTISHSYTVTIEPAPEASFMDLPMDMTLDCEDQAIMPTDLAYSNNTPDCLIEGMATPTVMNNADVCGGDIIIMWEFTDACDRTLSHVQTITINPADSPMFIDPPMDLNLLCSDVEPNFVDLEYTNSAMGLCLVEGTIIPNIVDNTTNCGGTKMATWEFTDACDNTIMHTQTITIEPPAEAMFVNPPANLTVSCNDVTSTADNLNYTNGDMDCPIEGEAIAVTTEDFNNCGGTITHVWEFTDDCDRTITHTQIITVEPAEEAMFGDLPADLMLTCNEFENFVPEIVDYTNGAMGNCLIEGAIIGVIDNFPDACGGDVSVLYEFTDACGRTISHTQTIMVSPADAAEFIDLPDNMTLSCSESNFVPDPLSYTNGELGSCLIVGEVNAIQSGSVDECGGVINYIWTFTDACNRTITHTQIVTFEAAPEPEWINPLGDEFLECDGELPNDLSLSYDNFEGFPCNISGTIQPEITEVDNVITLTWEFTNPCSGMTIMHEQNWTQSLAVDWEEDFFAITICQGESFDLSTLIPVDQNNTNPTITYHDDFPTSSSNNIGSSIVNPLTATTYYIEGNNSFDCPDFITVEIDLEFKFNAGEDNEADVCIDEQVINLFNYLALDADFAGNFFQTAGPSINISNPGAVNISSAEPGTYVFDYIIEATANCPEEVAVISITIQPPLDVVITSVSCATDFQNYMVEGSNNGYDLSVNAGQILEDNFDSFLIGNIPIGTDLIITVEDPNTGCALELSVAPPNCDCPDVLPPTAGPDMTICEGEDIPTLMVTVDADQTANWYDAPLAGTLLADGTTSYTPLVNTAGLYTFYIESESLIDQGCTSDTRVPIVLEILSNPFYADVNITICDTDTDGILSWDSLALQSFVNLAPTENIAYFASMGDAESNQNALSFPILNQSAFNDLLFARIANSAGCFTVIEINFTIHPRPAISASQNNVSCFGNMDASITINNFDPNSNYTLNDTLVSTANIENLSAGSYQLIQLDDMSCGDTLDLSIQDGLEIFLETFTWDCSDNGTNTDATDDFYAIVFQVNNSNGNAGMFTLFDDQANNLGVFAYGTEHTIQLPADDSNQIFSFTDNALSCSLDQSFGPLISCSTNCEITVDEISFECNDNGSGIDATDDFYELVLNVSAINGNSANRYNVAIDGTITFSFEYGLASSFVLPASGDIVTLTISDLEDPACSVNVPVGPLEPCSMDCAISIDDIVSDCSSNNTDTDPSDDFYDISLLVSALNGSSTNKYNLSIDGVMTDCFDYDVLSSFVLPANGNTVIIRVSDAENDSCYVDLPLGPLTPCSTNCTISIDEFSSDCNSNDSSTDPSDDFYELSLLVSSVNGSSTNTFILDIDGSISFVYSYNAQVDITLPANGDLATLTITDADDPACFETLSVGPLDPCSNDCSLTATVGNILCDDNGSNDENADDVYFFDIELMGVNTGSGYTISALSFNGEYNELYNLGPFDISQGPMTLIIEDNDVSGCITEVEIIPPPACSDCNQTITVNTPAEISCANPETNLEATASENGTYLWTGPDGFTANTPIASTTIPGTYTVLVSFANGCTLSQTVQVTADEDIPIAIIGPDLSLTCSITSVLLDASNSIYTPTAEFIWTNSDGEIISDELIHMVSEEGSYFFEIIDLANGCNSTVEEVVVSLNTNTPSAVIFADPGNILDCFIETINLTTEGEANVIYSWTLEGDITLEEAELTVDEAIDISLLAIDTISGCSDSTELSILDFTEFPIVILEQLGEFDCEGSELCLDVSNSPLANTLDFVWFDDNGNEIGTNNPVLCISEAGEYTVQLTDPNNGCVNTESITIDAPPITPTISLPSTITIEAGEEIELTVTVDIPEDEIQEIIWSPSELVSCVDCLTTTLVGATDGQVITVEVISVSDCIARASTSIIQNVIKNVYIPNIISGNSPFGNDQFTLYGNDQVERIQEMLIYDRWGELVFSAENIPPNDPSLGWDGSFKGQEAVLGVYVYVFEVVYTSGDTEIFAGDVALVK